MLAKNQDWIAEIIADLPPLVTTKEAIAILRMSQRSLYRLVTSGRIHAVRQAESGSSKLLIPKLSLERYLRSLEGQ